LGDLLSLLIGALSAAPLACSYFYDINQPWIKWGCLAIGFVIVSYRLWLRAENARTADAVAVLVADAEDILESMKEIIERNDWPVKVERRGQVFSLVRPVARTQDLSNGQPVLNQLSELRRRMSDHEKLVKQISSVHRIRPPIKTVNLEELNEKTILLDFRDYIQHLRTFSAPPPTLFASLSERRVQR
jgi:hypothetical protein